MAYVLHPIVPTEPPILIKALQRICKKNLTSHNSRTMIIIS